MVKKAKLMVLPQMLLVMLAFAAAVGTSLALTEIVQLPFMQEVSQGVEDRFGDVRGNLPNFLIWLCIIWVSAAFGEEMFFRGYLVTRLEEAFSGSVAAPVLAILVSASIFGFGHMYYQGMKGFVTTGLIGIAFGVMYLAMKKNLWPIVFVHGLVDTLGFVALYLDLE